MRGKPDASSNQHAFETGVRATVAMKPHGLTTSVLRSACHVCLASWLPCAFALKADWFRPAAPKKEKAGIWKSRLS